MIFDLENEHAGDAYKILSSLVTPRPIAWVNTLNEDGSVNTAPFSFFNVFGARPPMIAFAPGNREPGVPKDTARNIIERNEFVVHMVDAHLAETMNQTAASLPEGHSELEETELSMAPCDTISVPRIAEAPAALECKKHDIIEVGSNRLIIGIVSRVHAQEGIFDPEKIYLNTEAYQPIGRMAPPSWYCRTGDLFEMPRP